jgi:hypothetical protein
MKICMIHELDVGFFAATMRPYFEELGHEVCTIQGEQTYLDKYMGESKIDYLLTNEFSIESIKKELQSADFFILRFCGDAILEHLQIPDYAGKNNCIYKVHGSELRDEDQPYSLSHWLMEWYRNEPVVTGPRDWSLMPKYRGNVVTTIERPLDFGLIPKPKPNSPPFAITCPTSAYKKGTKELAEAMAHSPLPLKVLQGVPRNVCLGEKSKASIYIDRLGVYEHGPYGMNSAEAWAMHIPVFSQIRKWDTIFCPELEDIITPVDAYTLLGEIRNYIEDTKPYMQKTNKAYRYVKEVHDPRRIAKQYMALAEEIIGK